MAQSANFLFVDLGIFLSGITLRAHREAIIENLHFMTIVRRDQTIRDVLAFDKNNGLQAVQSAHTVAILVTPLT